MHACQQMTNIYSSTWENHTLRSTPSATHHLYNTYTKMTHSVHRQTCTRAYRTAKIEVCKASTQHLINMRSRIIHAIKSAGLHGNIKASHWQITTTVQFFLSWSGSGKELYRHGDERNACLTCCYCNFFHLRLNRNLVAPCACMSSRLISHGLYIVLMRTFPW